ncbi:MAG: nucleoside:proton symporter [Betaproteobacteria bacterium]|nr:MAG: nucleoside:proton symporter [Betaproteobacteria bacterium]TMH93955.1 MAG: nucleoside:proton symporter [Betaproteobacteria bacterium]
MEAGLVLHSLVGFFLLHAIAWALSEDRRTIVWRPVIAGMLLTFGLGLVLLKAPYAKGAFLALNGALDALEKATRDGTAFVFGFLGGGPLPFAETYPGASFVLAFRALPLVLVVSALSALLFHWRVLPWIVRGFSLVLEKTMGVGGAIGLSSAANVFVGMVEAPLIVKPYIRNMSRGELFILMSCGMATVAGTVMALYASILSKVIPDALGHILIASIISTPAAIAISVLMVPGKASATEGKLASQAATSSMDAVTRGTVDGAQLLVNIVAMLLVLVSLVSLANQVLALLPEIAGAPVTLQRLFGIALAPLVWIMGIPWAEATAAGALMGTKTVLNELLAYVDLARLPESALSPRSRLMMTYALCGFANFGSLGIMIGGLATMAPERRDEIVSLGGKTILSGTLATCVAGSVVGMLY